MENPGSELAIEIQFNCRVWLRQAIRVLMQQRMVCCERIKYLEDELERVATVTHRTSSTTLLDACTTFIKLLPGATSNFLPPPVILLSQSQLHLHCPGVLCTNS